MPEPCHLRDSVNFAKSRVRRLFVTLTEGRVGAVNSARVVMRCTPLAQSLRAALSALGRLVGRVTVRPADVSAACAHRSSCPQRRRTLRARLPQSRQRAPPGSSRRSLSPYGSSPRRARGRRERGRRRHRPPSTATSVTRTSEIAPMSHLSCRRVPFDL